MSEDSEINNTPFEYTIRRAPINYVGDVKDGHTEALKKERTKHLRQERKAERDRALLKTQVKRVKV